MSTHTTSFLWLRRNKTKIKKSQQLTVEKKSTKTTTKTKQKKQKTTTTTKKTPAYQELWVHTVPIPGVSLVFICKTFDQIMLNKNITHLKFIHQKAARSNELTCSEKYRKLAKFIKLEIKLLLVCQNKHSYQSMYLSYHSVEASFLSTCLHWVVYSTK